MILNCDKIKDIIIDSVNKLPLYTVGGDRVCSHYTDVIEINNILYVEIPINAVDIKYMTIMNKPDSLEFMSVDKTIANIHLTLADTGIKKQGNLYIPIKLLYKLTK